MGTTSEKLTYLNGTKQLLKDKINNLGGEIDNNTTFRQYANQLQTIYDNLPKTEYQEGTEISLGKTIKGKLDFDEDNGKKVVGIGQSEQYSTTGKNLFNLTDYNSNKWSVNYASNVVKTEDSITFDSSGGTQGVYFNTTNIASLIDNYDANKTYYISIDIEVDASSRFYWGSSNVRTTNITAGKQRISISDKISSALVFYNLDSSHNTISKIMICETNDTVFEKYTGRYSCP